MLNFKDINYIPHNILYIFTSPSHLLYIVTKYLIALKSVAVGTSEGTFLIPLRVAVGRGLFNVAKCSLSDPDIFLQCSSCFLIGGKTGVDK